MQLLKGLWITKFGFEKSIDELIEAYHMFSDVCGDECNYFGANCQLEVASNFMRTKEIPSAMTCLNQAVEMLEKLFGENHSLIQKYYNYSAELYSYAEDMTSMLAMAQKNLEIVENFNALSDPNDAPSLFILDGILQLVSMLCQANAENSKKAEVEALIARMENICGENGIVNGCQLLHSAYTMKSMMLIRQEKIKEALALLEETLTNQLSKLKGNRDHPFLE